MNEVAAILLSCIAASLAYAASEAASLEPFHSAARGRAPALRGAALAAAVIAACLWRAGEPGPASAFGVAIGLMAASIAVALLAPLRSRAVRASAPRSPPPPPDPAPPLDDSPAPPRSTARLEGTLRVAGAVIGSLPVALLGSACLARFLPVSEDARFAIAFACAIPLWIACMILGFLARSARRLWACWGAVGVGLAALILGMPR